MVDHFVTTGADGCTVVKFKNRRIFIVFSFTSDSFSNANNLLNGMNLLNISSFYQKIVKGIIILVAVLIRRKAKK